MSKFEPMPPFPSQRAIITGISGPGDGFAALKTDEGVCYVKLDAVVLIGPRVQRGKDAPARRIGFASNVYQFVTDTPGNLRALGLDDEAQLLEDYLATVQAATAKGKRTRKPHQKVVTP